MTLTPDAASRARRRPRLEVDPRAMRPGSLDPHAQAVADRHFSGIRSRRRVRTHRILLGLALVAFWFGACAYLVFVSSAHG